MSFIIIRGRLILRVEISSAAATVLQCALRGIIGSQCFYVTIKRLVMALNSKDRKISSRFFAQSSVTGSTGVVRYSIKFLLLY